MKIKTDYVPNASATNICTPTNSFRWEQYRVFSDSFRPSAILPYPNSRHALVLQQAWECNDGSTEWRDVTVGGE